MRRLRLSIRNEYLNRRYGYKNEPAVSWGYMVMLFLPSLLRGEWDHHARHLPRPQPGRNRLLDVGCGNGDFMVQARRAGWDAMGIDFDPKAAAVAKDRGMKVWVGDYRKAPFPTASFDAITSAQVIEHVHSPREFITQLTKWLKPGGTLWISTPNFGSLTRKIFGRDWYPLQPPQHLVLLNPGTLIKLMEDNGLSAQLLQRGFFEMYWVPKSIAMKHGVKQNDEVEDFIKKYQGIFPLIFELIAWLFPRLGSDMVVLGKKL